MDENSLNGSYSEIAWTSTTVVLALIAAPLSAEPNVPNPDVPCWLGEDMGLNAESGLLFWNTRDETKPYLITHDREQIRGRDAYNQADYNYLIYWFGSPISPIQARHYLGGQEVSLVLPERAEGFWTLEQAREAIPNTVACYLQKRFTRIDVFTENGYEKLWARGDVQ